MTPKEEVTKNWHISETEKQNINTPEKYMWKSSASK